MILIWFTVAKIGVKNNRKIEVPLLDIASQCPSLPY